MTFQSTDSETIGFYDKEAETYAAWSKPKAVPPELLSFAARLPAGGKVLDLGCGGGWASEEFRDRGFEVVAMDASQEMVRHVAGLANITARYGRFEDLEETDAYDAIWASFSLQHAERASMPGILDRIGDALRLGGWLYIGIHEGDEVLRDELGRLYNHYSEQGLTNMLADTGLSVARLSRSDSSGYDGRPIQCMHIEACKDA